MIPTIQICSVCDSPFEKTKYGRICKSCKSAIQLKRYYDNLRKVKSSTIPKTCSKCQNKFDSEMGRSVCDKCITRRRIDPTIKEIKTQEIIMFIERIKKQGGYILTS